MKEQGDGAKVTDVKARGTRRYLSAEKKYQIFLETERGTASIGEILRREGLFASDLQRIREQVRDGALERLKARPGPRAKAPSREEYEALRDELTQKERVLADVTVEMGALRKKVNGGSWDR
jgi:transposase-like protein